MPNGNVWHIFEEKINKLLCLMYDEIIGGLDVSGAVSLKEELKDEILQEMCITGHAAIFEISRRWHMLSVQDQ